MGVAALHLFFKALGHALPVELAALLTHHHLEGQIQKEVTQFSLEFRLVILPDGIHNLMGFLEKVGDEGFRGLGGIPRAVISKEGHQGKGPIQDPSGSISFQECVQGRIFRGSKIAVVTGDGHQVCFG